MRETVKWKRCLNPLNVTKDCGGKLLVVISQYGFSNSPGGHLHLKPPIRRLMQVPPFLQIPGTQRPERELTSQCSPMEKNNKIMKSAIPQIHKPVSLQRIYTAYNIYSLWPMHYLGTHIISDWIYSKTDVADLASWKTKHPPTPSFSQIFLRNSQRWHHINFTSDKCKY